MTRNKVATRGPEKLAIAALLAVASGSCLPRGCRSHDAPERLAIVCDDKPGSVIGEPGDLAPYSPSLRGAVVHCTKVAGISGAELARAAAGVSLPKVLAPSARVYRFSYRAARANGANAPGALAAATLIVPERLIDPEAIAVFAHGTIGFGEHCGEARPPGFAQALAAAGWITLVPEYAGFRFGAAPGWLSADDEARSIFDAIRAAKKILPEGYKPKRVAFVGHSQGGHAVLAAQAAARAEGLDAEMIGVVAFSPMWFSPHLFAKLATNPELDGDGGRDALWSMLYFYGHAELFDGPGKGSALLEEGMRERLAPVLEGGCAAEVEKVMRRQVASALLDPRFVGELARCEKGDCSAEASRWRARFEADLPKLDPKGAPVLVLQGSRDANVTLPRARCALDHARTATGLEIEACSDDADHVSIMQVRGGDALRWLAARDVGEAIPLTSCAEPTVACAE
jgi:acetyl esterase/lipase